MHVRSDSSSSSRKAQYPYPDHFPAISPTVECLTYSNDSDSRRDSIVNKSLYCSWWQCRAEHSEPFYS